MDDSLSSDDECIEDLIKRNNPAVRRAIDSMARARAASLPVRSPWQQEMDKIVAQDELDELPDLQERPEDSDSDNDDDNGNSRRASLVTPPSTKTTTKKKKHTNKKRTTGTKKKPSPKQPPKQPPKKINAATATAAQKRRTAGLPAKEKPTAWQQQVTKDKSLSDQYKLTVVMFLNWRDDPTPKFNTHMILTQNKLYTIKPEEIVSWM